MRRSIYRHSSTIGALKGMMHKAFARLTGLLIPPAFEGRAKCLGEEARPHSGSTAAGLSVQVAPVQSPRMPFCLLHMVVQSLTSFAPFSRSCDVVFTHPHADLFQVFLGPQANLCLRCGAQSHDLPAFDLPRSQPPIEGIARNSELAGCLSCVVDLLTRHTIPPRFWLV